MFRNILVSFDGSPHSQKALAEAIDLASESRGRLTILTAVQQLPPWLYGPASAGAVAQLSSDFVREAEETLRSAVDQVPDDVPLTKLLSRDPIRVALTRALDNGCYDVLVMGSRGRGPVTAQLDISPSSDTVIRPALTCPANRKMSSKSTGSPRYMPDGW